ncbi:hypothetical protein HMPREF1250_1500 [Megasphaera vaginalis (ex Srinivasan et al. 2021)]|uniref:Uncharacterized protein n=1 Tax=Megasphaera vaginalis (ex Srinivasan et al. 2021) TaxID=1111454 RepID=U7UAX2_9FIRM|nr:hypothetical protein HMPREF1250_1500 [Megasphaera vaginalis (ex Srinivasan et al. 2021)]
MRGEYRFMPFVCNDTKKVTKNITCVKMIKNIKINKKEA